MFVDRVFYKNLGIVKVNLFLVGEGRMDCGVDYFVEIVVGKNDVWVFIV